jgi:bacterioferritin
MPANHSRESERDARGEGGNGKRGMTPAPGPAPTASLEGEPRIISHLGRALRNELTAINQYFLHSRMLADWGLSELAQQEYDESIDEMKHADMLIKRILFLGGLPNLQSLGKLWIGGTVEEIIRCDLKLENLAHPDLKTAIADCESVGDYGSRELLLTILQSEETQIDRLQTQLRLIEQMGIQHFVALQTRPNENGM